MAYHDLPAEDFERQIAALQPNEPVHLSELIARMRAGKNTAGLFAITVDDGVATTVRSLAAVCQRRQWPITFYLPTAYLSERGPLPFQLWTKVAPCLPRSIIKLPSRTIDLTTGGALANLSQDILTAMDTKPRSYYESVINELAQWLLEQNIVAHDQLHTPEPISWAEVSDIARGGIIRFESHGATHTAVSALSPEELKFELEASKQTISEHTNHECRHFCYPFGGSTSIGKSAPAIVAELFESAVTMERGRLRGHSFWLLPRIPIYGRDGTDMTRLKVLTV